MRRSAPQPTTAIPRDRALPVALNLPEHRELYYGGVWHAPRSGEYAELTNPGSGEPLGRVAVAGALDVDAAVASARAGFREWARTLPSERAKILKRIAALLRQHAEELAMIDAADCGNPVREMVGDAHVAAAQMEFFAGLVTEIKGFSIPMGPEALNFSVREPLGVVVRIIPFNHPLMFCAGKSAAPLAAGNAVIVKPPEQAPLSSLRFAELLEGLLPGGAFNIMPGGREAGAALAGHPGVAKVALIGSVPTGRAVMRAAAETTKPVLLELGGKNALIAFPDADPDAVAAGIVAGMNFTWCGQSCGSTSRAFVHASIHDAVTARVKERCRAFRPGLPTDMATTMGALSSRAQYERVLHYIEVGQAEGARLLCGGGPPADSALGAGLFIEPTVFVGVTPVMRIANEEIFGPVLAILEWSDEEAMLEAVNGVGYGLTCSIWTRDLVKAHRTALRVEVGYVWINEAGRHYLGAPFGGVKQSGIGREECLDELLSFTQEKNIHVNLAEGVAPAPASSMPGQAAAGAQGQAHENTTQLGSRPTPG
jgi:betaine-aldehyde dehydrogenase